MKQSEIAMLILVISISLLVSFGLGGLFISSPENRSRDVQVIQPIGNTLSDVSSDIFNQQAINPSENITVGESDTQQPFQRSESQ